MSGNGPRQGYPTGMTPGMRMQGPGAAGGAQMYSGAGQQTGSTQFNSGGGGAAPGQQWNAGAGGAATGNQGQFIRGFQGGQIPGRPQMMGKLSNTNHPNHRP